jgi:hypothetical protein
MDLIIIAGQIHGLFSYGNINQYSLFPFYTPELLTQDLQGLQSTMGQTSEMWLLEDYSTLERGHWGWNLNGVTTRVRPFKSLFRFDNYISRLEVNTFGP